MNESNENDIYTKETNKLTVELLEISEKLESLIRKQPPIKS